MLNRKRTLYWLVLVAIMLPLTLIAVGVATLVLDDTVGKGASNAPLSVSANTAGSAPGLGLPLSFAGVLKPAELAVVNISSTRVVKNDQGELFPFLNDPFFRQFFGGPFDVPKERREQSLGSGVLVSRDGYILTNSHVVEGAGDVKVFLSDKRELDARVIGTDPKSDIAVVKIDGSHFPVLTLGDSSKTQVGDLVFAIGNPFGVGQTVTMGIVSATGRSNLGIEDYEDFIQTDAAINPGNSGGALVNAEGQVIGINTAILSRSGGNQGIGFAIPINMAHQVTDQVMKNGKVIRGWVGLAIQDLSPAIAKAFGLDQTRGVLIGDVVSGGPAARAGLTTGDIILAMNGEPVTDTHSFRLKVASLSPGTEVKLRILRKGRELDVPVKLSEMPEDNEARLSEKPGPESAMEGVVVDELTPDVRRELNLTPNTRGVVVLQVQADTPAAEAGLERGDVIQEVNRRPIDNLRDFQDAVRASDKGPLLLLVNRGGTTLFVAVEKR
ncbi:MAG: DegQ family serine endoprotease [Acidobacteriota bacterium]